MNRNLLFIPAYNCSKQIRRVLQSLGDEAGEWFHQIVIVDNRSTDETIETVMDVVENHSLRSKFLVVRNPQNIGLGGSHKMAFNYAEKAGFDFVTILHGDDQGSIEDFRHVFNQLRNEIHDLYFFGSRFSPASRLINYSWFRTAGNVAFNLLSSLLTRSRIEDLGGSGLNCFPVRRVAQQPYSTYSNDLTFHVYLLLNALSLGQPFRFIPISWREDDQISNVRLGCQAFKLLKLLWAFAFKRGLLMSQHEALRKYCFEDWEIVSGNLPEISI